MPDYSWHIEQCQIAPSENGLESVIKTLHWRCYATEGDEQSTCYGSIGLESPDPEAFEVYEGLTEATVVGWLKATLDAQQEGQVEQIEASLAGEIEKRRNPPIVTAPLPWAA
jgi:hypothetical protein